MIPPFDYPHVQELFGHLLDKLLGESGRGAVIIGSTHVDEYLLKLIKDTAPLQTKDYQNRLFNYPGPLSSFSARIELAYAFRLINKVLYDALNELRKVRNDAAHSSTPFSLVAFKDRMTRVYQLGPYFPDFIREQAMRMMIAVKKDMVMRLFEEHNIPDELKGEQIKRLISDETVMKTLEDQLPHWELIFGVTFLCGYLAYERENTLNAIKEKSTWSSLAKKSFDNSETNQDNAVE